MPETFHTPEGIILIGPPGSGKSSHTSKLGELEGSVIIRGRNIVPDQVSKYEGQRALIPEDVFIPSLREALTQIPKTLERIVFDNIPRSTLQAEVVVDWAIVSGTKLTTIALELTEEEVSRRFRERTACPDCNSSYHDVLKPSAVAGFCDKDQTPLVKRAGDKPENVAHAYRRHEELVRAIKDPLAKAGAFYEISAEGKIDDAFKRIASALGLQ